MKNIFQSILNLLPSKEEINKSIQHFSKKEYFFFLGLVAVFLVSTLFILQGLNKSFMVKVPMKGGSITEGIVGTPRFINPVLAFSDTDQDLVSLLYSGLMRKNENGDLLPDLASSYEVSEDGLVYTFTLKDKLYFHNDTPILADDIVFTIDKIKDSTIKSPRKGSWDGITVEKLEDKVVKFTLRQPYASFLENTTLGIMPKAIWNDTPIELNEANILPIGSGPFKVGKTSKLSSGLVEFYNLLPFEKWSLGRPYLDNLNLRFYANEADVIAALSRGEVNQISSITPESAEVLREKGFNIESLTLPRVFGLFFNQNSNQIFTDKNVIKAIDLAINKEQLIKDVLLGYGISIDGPIPLGLVENSFVAEASRTEEEGLDEARNLLRKNGWTEDGDGFLEKKTKTSTTPLSFSISTGNAPELGNAANLIRESLEKIGMRVEIKTFEIGNLNQSVIRTRDYDALLFGQIINHESDLFAFWHSSQRKDPGLNVAIYTNTKVDKILEEAFVTVNEQKREEKYIQFENEIRKDLPAVFLYSPDFIYVISKDLQGFSLRSIVSPANRFLNSYLWYTKTDNVWKMFSN